MSRFWLALAKFAAKRAGGRFLRTLEIARPMLLPDEPWFDSDAA